ncbi:MAG: oxygen-independent coproporphyrinogen III oxidase-like protein, partial [Gammaproteobacteria bacterium]|nr:oxygen-independent coproporphyrinogen III oxidase-like protein [Gammaproteobacteria bacterium]
SKLTMNESDTIFRMARQKHPQAYLDTAGTKESLSSHEMVSVTDRPFEFLMNALRLIDGVEAELFTQRTMLELAVASEAISQAQETGLLMQDNRRIQASTTGLNYLNNLLEYFLPK